MFEMAFSVFFKEKTLDTVCSINNINMPRKVELSKSFKSQDIRLITELVVFVKIA